MSRIDLVNRPPDGDLALSPEVAEGGYKNGADAVVAALENAGIDTVFAYPGGASMLLHQSLTRSRKIRTILPRHEQGGAFMAEGYARASGKVGVCMATSGPGATNLVTGIADAYMDSVPLVAITGQVMREMIGRGAFQETDVFGITLPIVKHSYLVISADDIPAIVREAVLLARTGRPGPVLLDIPKDVQQAPVRPKPPEGNFGGCKPVPRASDAELEAILLALKTAERPLLYVGGGIISGEACDALRRFAEATHVPVTTTLMGLGCFPETHELSLRWLGMHGTVYANYAADACDLLLAMGVRFDDRVTGNVDEFAKRAKIVHLDVDSSELNKNKRAHLPILGDVRDALERLNAMLEAERRPQKPYKAWHAQIAEWKARYPFSYRAVPGAILPQQVVEELFRLTKGEAIITTGVGQHQMWAAQFYQFIRPRSFLSSSGLGSMGFGFPAALGAKVAFPNRQVIDIDGDGSFLMNIQELATAVTENIPAKAVILNNQHLGMVVQWEDRFFSGNRAHTFLGDPRNVGRHYPSYRKICEGFGVPAEEVRKPEELRPALERLLSAETPYVVDVHVPYTEHVLPMIPAGMTVHDIILDSLPDDKDPAAGERGRAP
ncbi:Acetolactate synthase large subunit [Methylacidimicrobium sp. AP8]|uniref:biosynthetic-type acetolactate synthase large subunit n=1 Tax=Methylacidimicrobium sp. AP8 TaxID=2730359 RepID=UPI0018C081F9|nr:biosynthetic-type acetolactate synthase large subunit [Methylacidimicrobium sp. AP8]CAB4244694.1 Acetolactate synthase large subunit [Methylacidimicrobium sp. AP8]